LIVVVAGALAIGYFGWLRDSSLVAVRDVEVEGVDGADSQRIAAALTGAARDMTTLHVRQDDLKDAVRQFPTVASVSADPSFPHGLTVHVTERRPVLIASDGDREVAVAADGSLLPGVEVKGDELPGLRVDRLPAEGRLSGDPLSEARAVGAAPGPLRPLVADVDLSGEYGIVLTMRGGIELRFGAGAGLEQKWAAVAAILADEQLTGISYLDVRVPERPAAGGASTTAS
jgi:cell division protein FtsQ